MTFIQWRPLGQNRFLSEPHCLTLWHFWQRSKWKSTVTRMLWFLCLSLCPHVWSFFFFSIQAFHLPYPLQMFSGMQRKQDNNEREKQHSQSRIHRAEWLFPDMPAHWYHHAGWLNECSFHIFNFVCWESIQVVYIFNKDLGRFRLKLAIVHHLKIISFEW